MFSMPIINSKPPSPSRRRRTTCFLGCFGCSGQNNMQPIEKVNSTSSRRSFNFSFKKSKTKTVPFDQTTVSRSSKSANHSTWEIQVVEEEDEKLTKKPVILVDEKSNHAPALSDEQNTRRKKWLDTVKRQNGSTRSRRKETKAEPKTPTTATVAGGHHDSPLKKSLTTISNPIDSSTLKPEPTGKKLNLGSPASAETGEKDLVKTTPLYGGFDSVIGMSILLVTLLIMVLWGKLCAIICTCAWFFIAPKLVAGGNNSAVPTAEKRRLEIESYTNLDLESVEYKKKVVLEGLLQRNHRSGVVGRRL